LSSALRVAKIVALMDLLRRGLGTDAHRLEKGMGPVLSE
jgi:hypothetical protein